MANRRASKRPKLRLPYYPGGDDNKGHYNLNVYEEKLVADYCNITIFEVLKLELFDFWYLLRDAAVYNYSQTEEGQKYLNNCWRMEQTQPDKEKLREKFGRGAQNGR